MNIRSDYKDDRIHRDLQPGGYEWWYFDAVSSDDHYSMVVIFYNGNPFSTRYIRGLEDSKQPKPVPSNFPAVSISLYKGDRAVYYSFTEFGASDCEFGQHEPSVRIGPHAMKSRITEEALTYEISLDETLPSGDRIKATLRFEGAVPAFALAGEAADVSDGHSWNLVQPAAGVNARIRWRPAGEAEKEIIFEGKGYHDHNLGNEPMYKEFEDWYWGRIHFTSASLVYYVMNRNNRRQYRAWLIDPENAKVILRFRDVTPEDRALSWFGLTSARKITLYDERARCTVQHARILDNGPFYQRFMSDAFLQFPEQDVLETKRGFSEYLRPGRIRRRFFWPLVEMRIRQSSGEPHWVQRSKRLYRWTW